MCNKYLKWLVYMVAAIALAMPMAFAKEEARVYNEFEVRAAFIYRVLHYVKWNNVSPDSSEVLVLCSNAVGPLSGLLRSLEKQKVYDRKIKVLISKNPAKLNNCSVAYLNNLSDPQVRQYVEKFKGKNVLTIGEQIGFAHAGGVLNLLLLNQRIDFEVNLDAADRQEIKFSAKFLRIAKNIIRDPMQANE